MRPPEPQEIIQEYEFVSTFRMLKTGLNVIRDPLNKNSIIAIIEFTKFEDMTSTERENLNFVSTFLHKSQCFIQSVKSSARSWGGKMWAIGWRKSSDKGQIVGKYITTLDDSQLEDFHAHYLKSRRLGQIIGDLFKKLAEIPFGANHELMKKNNLPSLAHLEYGEELTDSDCAPHITFTTNGFFNPPHIDTKDISPFAFVMFIPTRTHDGSLILNQDEYDITSGPFIFPDHKFGIDFDHQFGLVKMLWQANKYTHCTMPSSISKTCTRLGMSVQINLKIDNACVGYQKRKSNGVGTYFGDHFHYLYRTILAPFLQITQIMLFFLWIMLFFLCTFPSYI